jgi:hypothetical protein
VKIDSELDADHLFPESDDRPVSGNPERSGEQCNSALRREMVTSACRKSSNDGAAGERHLRGQNVEAGLIWPDAGSILRAVPWRGKKKWRKSPNIQSLAGILARDFRGASGCL